MYQKKVVVFPVLIFIALVLLISLPIQVPDQTQLLNLQERIQQLHHCPTKNQSRPTEQPSTATNPTLKCPDYFSWIHHDLALWKSSGITQQNLLRDAQPLADFRVVIVQGKLYTERYRFCYQTRAQYTLWGLLMLLQKYPGKIPDLDLMFSCGDRPSVFKKNYSRIFSSWPPPPVFSYCTTRKDHHDIVFPDWSFWGWPEVNIAPWSLEREKIFAGAQKLGWSDRDPVAQWKGNTWMGKIRPQLVKCNSSSSLLIMHQDWESEVKQNFTSSSLSKQCSYRYKVYVEGIGWSVSLKYIMACGSTLLRIEPDYLEFYSRSLIPFLHFWPVSKNKICKSIREAVQWGNSFPVEAGTIGKCAQVFLKQQLTMDNVYEYMLHLLQNYAKLLKFQPVPPQGVEAMSLDSDLPWHEMTMPRPTSHICSLDT